MPRNIKAAAAGTNTVTVTFNASTPFVDIRALEYSGLDPVNPFDVGTSASGNGTRRTAARSRQLSRRVDLRGRHDAGCSRRRGQTSPTASLPPRTAISPRIALSRRPEATTRPLRSPALHLAHAGRHVQGRNGTIAGLEFRQPWKYRSASSQLRDESRGLGAWSAELGSARCRCQP